jgi:hypothetical protein
MARPKKGAPAVEPEQASSPAADHLTGACAHIGTVRQNSKRPGHEQGICCKGGIINDFCKIGRAFTDCAPYEPQK